MCYGGTLVSPSCSSWALFCQTWEIHCNLLIMWTMLLMPTVNQFVILACCKQVAWNYFYKYISYQNCWQLTFHKLTIRLDLSAQGFLSTSFISVSLYNKMQFSSCTSIENDYWSWSDISLKHFQHKLNLVVVYCRAVVLGCFRFL